MGGVDHAVGVDQRAGTSRRRRHRLPATAAPDPGVPEADRAVLVDDLVSAVQDHASGRVGLHQGRPAHRLGPVAGHLLPGRPVEGPGVGVLLTAVVAAVEDGEAGRRVEGQRGRRPGPWPGVPVGGEGPAVAGPRARSRRRHRPPSGRRAGPGGASPASTATAAKLRPLGPVSGGRDRRPALGGLPPRARAGRDRSRPRDSR